MFQVKCIFGYWELTLGIGNGLGRVEGVNRRKESRMFHQGLLNLSPENGRRESEERTQQKVCYRAGDEPGGWTWRNEGKSEYMQLSYLLPWSEWPVGSQGVLTGIGT